MTHKLVISGRLDGLNEYIRACRTNRYKGAQMKHNAEAIIRVAIASQLRGVKVRQPVYIRYHWVEKDKRRDMDNVAGFGHKVIQDALVQAKVLVDDGWGYITGFRDDFSVDKKNPRIEVEIEEIR